MVLGIDIGSTFIKSSILDLETLSIQHSSSVPTPDFIDKSGYTREIPIEALADLVKKMIEDAVASYAVEGILFSVQMHGFMLFERNGNPITNYISWQDMRGNFMGDQEDAASFIRHSVNHNLLAQNGIFLKNTHSLSPLYCYMKQKKISEPVHFSMMGDGIIRLLTGTVPPIHSTVAASSGLYSLTAKDWNRELADELGLGNLFFPPVDDGPEPAAFYTSAEKKCIPIYTAVGDHQAAVLGACTEDDHTVINIGTGGQISYVDKGLHFGTYETRPFFYGRTLRALTQLPSGRSLNVLADFVMDIGQHVFSVPQIAPAEVWKLLDHMAEEAQSADDGEPDLRVNLSFFNHTAPDSGSIMEIGSSNLRVGNLFYRAYAYMAAEYCTAFQKLFSDTDSQTSAIIYTGGVLRKSRLLQQLIQKKLKRPCHLAPHAEDTMIGLLRLALWYGGYKAEFETQLLTVK